MKNPLVRLIGIFVLAVVLLFVGRDMIAKAAVGHIFKTTTGLRLGIGSLHSNPLKSVIGVADLKLYNPPPYSEKVMFVIPVARIGFNLGSILSGKPHLTELYVHLAELKIERNKDGKLNLSELKPKGKKNPAPGKKPASTPTVSVDLLRLKIDKVIYKDLSRGTPSVREFNLNIDKTYRDIKDVKALVPIIISDTMRNGALRALVNFDVGDLLRNFEAGGINISDLGLDQFLGSGIGQTAQGVVGSVADQLGSLFGSSKDK